MQRLEVGAAVRHIYMSLGFKRLKCFIRLSNWLPNILIHFLFIIFYLCKIKMAKQYQLRMKIETLFSTANLVKSMRKILFT